jgi:primosomal protein N' (replication factor Y)
MSFVSVAVPVPALPALTYRVPADLAAPPIGVRVLVPLGTRVLTGVVVGMPEAAPDETTVREILDVLDQRPFLPEGVVSLALWVSEYYLAPPGDAIAAAMPPFAWVESERRYERTAAADAGGVLVSDPLSRRLLERLAAGPRAVRALANDAGETSTVRAALRTLERRGLVARTQGLVGRANAFRTELTATLTAAGMSLARAVASDEELGLRQKNALEILAGARMGLAAAELRTRGIALGTLRRLATRGLVHLERQRRERDPFGRAEPSEAPTDRLLTDEQAAACATVSELVDRQAFQTVLVHGVTGSGKTELYLRLAQHAISRGRRVLILVPEIALTPQVARQFRQAFGDRVAIQHSGLAAGERHDQWHRIRDGLVDLVVGTRSAVFTPLDALGLIVVDEEHDTSYKQEESPRYHGRDVAIVRAQQAGAVVALGSATPAMETYFNADSGRYARVVLSRRVLDRPLAVVRIVDMREEYAAQGPEVILSALLVEALRSRLGQRQQSLLLLNRRGFSTAVFCRQCGHVLDCPNCSVSLTVHERAHGGARAICHYCSHTIRVPTTCPECAAPYIAQSGFGTERVEAEVARLFPDARIGRVDRDTMQKRGAIERILSAFRAGELDVLVGTQMIAKGHDFPRVTLVGVVSADMGLGLADFRAAERTFQLLTQVAGRAGRGDEAGEAIVQTIHPDHYSIKLACRQDYEGFYREELRYRTALRYPPAIGLVNVVVRGRSLGEAMGRAHDLVSRVGAHDGIAVLGPAPAPLTKLRGEFRAQFFLKSRHRRAMRHAISRALDEAADLARQVSIDVDPVAML